VEEAAAGMLSRLSAAAGITGAGRLAARDSSSDDCRASKRHKLACCIKASGVCLFSGERGGGEGLGLTSGNAAADVHGGDLGALARLLAGLGLLTLANGGDSSAVATSSSGSTSGSIVDDDTNTGTTLASAELDDGSLGQGVLGVLEGAVEALEVTLGLGGLAIAGGDLLAHTLESGDGGSYGEEAC
jgi:hypothetical protein